MSYTPFKQMEAKLAHRPGVSDPAGLAAFIARRKYGNKAVQHAAASGKSLRGHRPLSKAQHKKVARFVRGH